LSKQTSTAPKPIIYVAMPCYDSVHRDTVVSLMKLFGKFRDVGISSQFNIVRSSLVNHARNLATCGFLASRCTHMLFIDADVEFEPEAVLRMLVVKKDIVCTPYRVKLMDAGKIRYAVDFEDEKKIEMLPGEIIEVEQGPAGLMVIHRPVFDKLMEVHPEMHITYMGSLTKDLNSKYLYNFWDTTFDPKKGLWKGEDLSFCDLARSVGFKIYANTESSTIHHGDWGWEGKFGDTIKKN
jgi:hypothetical protein